MSMVLDVFSSGSGSTAGSVAGGAGLAGGLIQSISSPFLQKWSQDFARHEAGQAWERGMESWRQQNEYNLPVNQMKRLKDAGLNPHLMYGKGAIDNTASGAPSGQKASQPDFSWNMSGLMSMLDILGKYQDVKRKSTENDFLRWIYRGKAANAKAQYYTTEAIIQKAYADADTASEKASIAELDHQLKQIYRNYAMEGIMPGYDLAGGRIMSTTKTGSAERNILLNLLAGIGQAQKSLGVGFGFGKLNLGKKARSYKPTLQGGKNGSMVIQNYHKY